MLASIDINAFVKAIHNTLGEQISSRYFFGSFTMIAIPNEEIKKSAIKTEKKSVFGCADDQTKPPRKRKAMISEEETKDRYDWANRTIVSFFLSNWPTLTPAEWAAFQYPGYEGITIVKKLQYFLL